MTRRANQPSVLIAVASISRHFKRTASAIVLLAGKLACFELLELTRSLSSRFESDLLLPFDDDALLDVLLAEVDETADGESLAGARNFFQFLINVLDRAITSSSLLHFLSSFTVMPTRVFVSMFRSMFRFCRIFSSSSACSWPEPSGALILANFFWMLDTSLSTLIAARAIFTCFACRSFCGSDKCNFQSMTQLKQWDLIYCTVKKGMIQARS